MSIVQLTEPSSANCRRSLGLKARPLLWRICLHAQASTHQLLNDPANVGCCCVAEEGDQLQVTIVEEVTKPTS